MPETDTKKILPLLSSSPRKNLPHSVSSKRTENNFALSFARSYIKSKKSKSFVAARELQMNGYGIPDLVFLFDLNSELSYPKKNVLVAFEVKVKDWRRAIPQAFRYKYFANASIVVLPLRSAKKAQEYIHTFKSLAIGLWTFDKKTDRLTKLYTPRYSNPINESVHQKASGILIKKFRLRQSA